MDNVEVSSQAVSHERGEVGVATPSATVKRLHLVEQNGKGSLKQFVYKLARDKDNPNSSIAQKWLANKRGVNRDERSDKNIAMARTCATATHSTRRKAKSK